MSLNIENYEVDDPELKTLLRSIGAKIGAVLKEGWGFTLFLFQYGSGGANFYISKADRADVIAMLHEWLAKQEGYQLKGKRDALAGNWHKLVAVMVHKLGDTVVISQEDIEAVTRDNVANVAVEDQGGVLTLRVVGDTEAMRLAKLESSEKSWTPPEKP